MQIRITQTITNTLNENRELIKTLTTESFSLTPDVGKVLRNKITGTIIKNFIVVSSEKAILNYEEIDDPDTIE